jgi:hypothetical protein
MELKAFIELFLDKLIFYEYFPGDKELLEIQNSSVTFSEIQSTSKPVFER